MYDRMVAHAVEGLPNEACGVIAAREGRPVRMFPVRNAEDSPVVYRFDERQQLEVFNEVDDQGLNLLGFWHSHTHTEAYPSLEDRANPIIRAFRFEDGAPVEEEVRIS